MDYQIYTPITLWQDFNYDLPLDVSVVKEYTENDICYKEVYFSGRNINGLRPRIYGMTAIREGYDDLPAIMIVNDFGLTVDKSFLDYFAKAGYRAFMIDVGGENKNYAKYTIYPETVSYANYINRNKTGDVQKSAKETCWYEWTAACRYGLSYLKSLSSGSKIGIIGIRSGGNIAWQLSAIEDRIVAACSLFAAGWKLNTVSELTENMQKWLAGLATESYAIKTKVPMMYLSDSNDDYCHMDKAYDTLNRVPEETPLLYAFSPRLKNIIGYRTAKNILLFFSKFLKNKNIALPSIPKLTSNIESDQDGAKVILKLSADTFDNIEEVDIFYAEDETNPEIRNWKSLKLEKIFEGVYRGECEMFSSRSQLYAYAFMTYSNGLTVSSNMLTINLDNLKLNLPVRRKSQVIYNSDMSRDTFTCYTFDEETTGVDILLQSPNVKVALGPMGIYGITTSYKALASYKISDPFFNSDDDKIFKFDVYSEKPQEMELIFMEYKSGNITSYRTQVELLGGQVWQPVEIKISELKSEDGFALKTWKDVFLFAFKSVIPAMYNNILWL